MAANSTSHGARPDLWARIGTGRTPAAAGVEAWTVALRIGANGLVAQPRRSEDAELVLGRPSGRFARRSLVTPLAHFFSVLESAVHVALDLSELDSLDPTSAVEVLRGARSAGHAGGLWLIAADLELLSGVTRLLPDDLGRVGTLHMSDPRSTTRGAEAHAASLRDSRIDGVLVPEEHTSAGLVALMRRFGRVVYADGADYRRTVRRALGNGVHGVIGSDAEALHDGWTDL